MFGIVFLSTLAVAASAAIATTFVDVHRDGYRRIATEAR